MACIYWPIYWLLTSKYKTLMILAKLPFFLSYTVHLFDLFDYTVHLFWKQQMWLRDIGPATKSLSTGNFSKPQVLLFVTSILFRACNDTIHSQQSVLYCTNKSEEEYKVWVYFELRTNCSRLLASKLLEILLFQDQHRLLIWEHVLLV